VDFFWENRMEKSKEYSVSIMGLKVEGISTENTDNVRQALIILLKNHPQIFEEKKTPQEVLQALGFNFQETKKTETGRWAQAAKRLSKEHPITPSIDAILQKGIEEFRTGFSLGTLDINQPET
jgi:hypothetical protein